MRLQIDEIAAIRSCWHPARSCTGRDDCACVPKSSAVATSRAIAAELPALRCFPTGDGGVKFECFDDPPSVVFRGFTCRVVEACPDGSIFACDEAGKEKTWPMPPGLL